MGTHHSDGLAIGMDTQIRKHPELAASICEARDKIMTCKYDPDFIRFVFQNHWNSVSMEDAFAFAVLWSWWLTGRLFIAKIDVGMEPSRDKHRDGNRLLLQALPGEFRADVWESINYCDGTISWNAPITMFGHEWEGEQLRMVTREFPAASAPLEIGTTASSRSLLHVFQSLSLARWAYGSRRVILGATAELIERVAMKRKRCAIYTRSCTSRQCGQPDSRKRMEEFAESNGWRSIQDMYDDSGIDGHVMDRPAMNRLISDAEAGKFDVVLVEDATRISRSMAGVQRFLDRLRVIGVDLAIVSGGERLLDLWRPVEPT